VNFTVSLFRFFTLQYRSLLPMYYRNAAAAIVVYDITNEASFDVLQDWIKELNRLGPEDIVLAIAANKCDLEDKREVRRGFLCRQIKWHKSDVMPTLD